MTTRKPLVFVLMPFDDSFTEVYEQLIKTPLDAVGFEVRRADSDLNQRNILSDVVQGIAEAALIVADVTGLNENVLYELGLAHALGKRTVMITQVLDELPFDLRPYRANEYSVNFMEATKLAELLSDLGNAVLQGIAEFSNPVQDFAPHALGQAAQVSDPPRPAIPRESGSEDGEVQGEDDGGTGPPREPTGFSDDGESGALDEPEEPGWLEKAVAMEAASEELNDATSILGTLTEQIGNKIDEAGERMLEVRRRLGDQASKPVLLIANELAKDLNEYADALPTHQWRMDSALGVISDYSDTMARIVDIQSDDDAEGARVSIEGTRQLETVMAESRRSTVEFAQSLASVPHVSRDLTRASRHAASVVEGTAESLLNGEAQLARARKVLEQRLAARGRAS